MLSSFCFLGTHICGGVILTEMFILTAAHCLTEASTRGSIEILAGRHNLGDRNEVDQRIEIERNRWLIHPNWNAGRDFGPFDIAIVSYHIML